VTAARIVRREAPACADWPEDVHPVLRRVYAARGLRTHAETKLGLADLLSPALMGGIDAAVSLLVEAIRQDRRIVVVGDFDCDGATGVAVGVRGLRMLGARHVAYRVPHRIEHGYGLTPALVDALRVLDPQVVVTVDNGIACHSGIAAAKAQGWSVLVTDHHLPGAVLPPADAIVNPNLAGDIFPSKALAGVGTLFYLLLATRQRLRGEGWFDISRFAQGEPDLACLLDLVAVGTIADMVPLDANNRVLVAAGLRRMRKGQCLPGLRALVEVAGRRLDRLGASDIGFFVAPRLNAAGRLEDMAIGVECLLSDDPAHAAELARTLDAINRERRDVQESMLDDASLLVAATAAGSAVSVCVRDARWHPGVVGLVASKLKDRLHRPVIAFAPAAEAGGEWRGSARSIPGFHIRDALAEVDAMHPGLIRRFGGHAMAAGLSLMQGELDAFAAAFETAASRRIAPELLEAVVMSDGELGPGEFGLDLARRLRDGGPWGQGFPEPQFDGRFEVRSWRVVGERHLKYELDGFGARIDAIEFGGWTGEPPPPSLRIVYRLDINTWRDRESAQLVIVHREP
jgi:single-stranded-DNA-specific exonuclease